MMLVAGIDEAGYGPVLGPLVVSATAFLAKAEDTALSDDLSSGLWGALAPVVTKKANRYGNSILVGDSKRLYSRSIGLKNLETAALAFLGALGRPAPDRESLLAALSLEDVAGSDTCPWHIGARLDLPVEADPLTIAYKVSRLKTRLAETETRFCGAKSVVISAREFNAGIRAFGNKAHTLFESVGRLLKWIAGCAQGERFIAHVDKQGGRDHYGDQLERLFPGAAVRTITESRQVSRYAVRGAGVEGIVGFCMDSEDDHLPVALASMYSKYLRELDLRLFNRFWQDRVPDLKATAGYATDGLRFLSQIRPAMKADGIDADIVARIR